MQVLYHYINKSGKTHVVLSEIITENLGDNSDEGLMKCRVFPPRRLY
jgi:hypothetical protein